jgi:hypothetical protein
VVFRSPQSERDCIDAKKLQGQYVLKFYSIFWNSKSTKNTPAFQLLQTYVIGQSSWEWPCCSQEEHFGSWAIVFAF